MQLSVLVIDLVGYSERLAALEEQVPNAGEPLNRQIEEFVSAAIASARLALASSTIGRAARMEAGCKSGSVMLDKRSFQMLPTDLRSLYLGPETLVDKNKAAYAADQPRASA